MTSIFVLFTIGRHFLVYWPEEDCYSEVPQSKVVGEPTDTIQVKERGKIYVGQLKGVGTKEQSQQKLNSILGESSQPSDSARTNTVGNQPGKRYTLVNLCDIQAVIYIHV